MESVLREQLTVAKEETTQKLGVIMWDLMQCFEGETLEVCEEVAAMQQMEIQILRSEIERLQQELSMQP